MKKLLVLLTFIFPFAVSAQDDLQKMLDSMNASTPQPVDFVRATFKTTRVINFPSVETVGKNILDFRISHRFGDINTGVKNFFGLDGPAGIRLGFDYGINSWLMVGIGRSSVEKMIDANIKARLLRQTSDNKKPIGITYQGTMNCTTMDDPTQSATGIDRYDIFTNRLSFAHTLTIARKFNNNLSLQLHGFYIHYNLVDKASDKNDMIAFGISGRYKLTQRMALTFEYAYRANTYSSRQDDYYDAMGIGLDLETGGHVFQLHITNGFGMNEAQFIPFTRSNPFDGGIRIGFNISRVFTIGKHEGSTW